MLKCLPHSFSRELGWCRHHTDLRDADRTPYNDLAHCFNSTFLYCPALSFFFAFDGRCFISFTISDMWTGTVRMTGNGI